MAAINPYLRYSDFQHLPSHELVFARDRVLNALFPDNTYEEIQLSVFFLISSAGKYMLLLGDTLAFVNLSNFCDPLSEICPVEGACLPRGCSVELQQAVHTHGQQIAGAPPLVALEISLDTRNRLSKLFYPSYTGVDPQAELVRLISRQATDVYIGNYHIRQIENSWQPPTGHPQWQGIAFEQSDRLMHAWFHEPNPHALQSAREETTLAIERTENKQSLIQEEIQRKIRAGRFTGAAQEQLNRDLAEVNQLLQEQHKQLSYLKAQTVNSAAHTTFQCAITMQIDQRDKIQLLERSICQKIVATIDNALQEVSWVDLQISKAAIENFIRCKFNALKARIPRLAERTRGTLLNWVHFRDEVMPKRERWIQGTFEEFRRERADRSLVEVEKEWKTELSERLKWVTQRLHSSSTDLKIMQDHTFAEIDITLFDAHREKMVEVLRKGKQMSYSLGLKLEMLYSERDFLRESMNREQRVHLVKRVTTSGDIYCAVTRPPINPADHPDPNSDFNEVHIPVINIQPIVRQAIPRLRPPLPARSLMDRWKWKIVGISLLAGAWYVKLYLQQANPDQVN